jgi:putative two-component system response regulator
MSINALLLGLNPETVGFIQGSFSRENIGVVQSKTLKHATYLLDENDFFIYIIDSSLPWIKDIILAIKGKDIFAPIIILNTEMELTDNFYDYGVNHVFNRPIKWDELISLSFNSVLFYQAHKNAKDEFSVYTTLVKVLNFKDSLTKGHGERTADISLRIFDKLGLRNYEDREALRIGGLLHDIGKVGIPDYILKSNHSLSDDDFKTMKEHPGFGVTMVKDLVNNTKVIDIIKHHHEKIDGTGYPDGLYGNQIDDLTKIVTVADVFDALTNNRTYRSKNSVQEAIKIMQLNFAEENKISKEFFEVLKSIVLDPKFPI